MSLRLRALPRRLAYAMTGCQEPVTLATPAASPPALSRSGRRHTAGLRHTVNVRPFAVARFHRRPKAGWERPSNPNPNPNLNPNPNPNPSLSPSPTGRALACRFGDRVVIAEFVNVSAVRRPPPAAARATTVAFLVTRAYSNPNPNPKPNPNPNPNPSLNPNPNPDPDPNPNPNPNPSTSPNPNPNPNQVTHAYDRVASLPAIAIDPMITSGR